LKFSEIMRVGMDGEHYCKFSLQPNDCKNDIVCYKTTVRT